MPVSLHWHTEPLLLLTVLGAGWLYLMAVGPLRGRLAPAGTPWPRGKAAMFVAGLAVAYLAVGSPLDQLGEDYLFSAHMVQHMLLIYGAPPLLVAGVPGWLADGLLRGRAARAVWRRLAHPVFAGVLLTACYTAWHFPTLYELALREKFYHVLEHWMMFAPAVLMWWPILSPSRRVPPLGYGGRMVYVFVLMVAQFPVFGFLSFSGEVLYPTYAWAPRIVPGLDALGDQVLGGILMKVVNMGVSLTILGISFYQWYLASERAGGAQAGEALRRGREA